MADLVKEVLQKHRGKLVGGIGGFLLAITWLHYGFWRTMFIGLLVSIGFWVGKRLDEEHSSLAEWLDRFLPTGQR